VVAEIDPLALRSRVEETQARIRELREGTSGVERKKPKPEEIERARVLAQRARHAHAAAEEQRDLARSEQEDAVRDAERASSLHRGGSITDAELEDAELRERKAKQTLSRRELLCRVAEQNIRASDLEYEIEQARTKDFDWEDAAYRARIEAAEATLRALADDLARTRITAPTRGVVLKRFLESEQPVSAGTAILELGDLERLEVEVDFLSEDAAHMRVGMTAELFGRALGDRVVAAKITRIHPSAFEKISSLGVEQQRVTVEVGFEGDECLGLGDRYRVDVRVILDTREDALLVPEGALFRHRGEWHAFREIGGKAVLTRVHVGLGDGRFREVLDGLTEGDSVVLHPPREIEDGSALDPLDE